MHWLALFVGGGLGACLRVALATAIDLRLAVPFPWGLLVVNIAGCFGAGFIATLVDEHAWFSTTARHFAVAGVLGGFTTFSSFGIDTLRLATDGRLGVAALNASGSLILALLGVAAGIALARAIG